MRVPVPWMGQIDERILEQLAENGATTAWEIGLDIVGITRTGSVSERCKVLADAKLVEREDRDLRFGRVETYWSITTWGRLYLSEEVDPGLDVPEPGPRPPHATRPSEWAGF